jgi:hypothetical protein
MGVMKATLKFWLPEERFEYACAVAGADALSAINVILSECRSKLKYGSGEFKDCDDATIEKVRDFIVDLKQYRNLPEIE